MNKRALPMEWVVAENDTDWERLCTQSMPDRMQAGQPRLSPPRFLTLMSAMLVLLAIAAGWVWQRDQLRMKQIKADLTTTIQHEHNAVTEQDLLADTPIDGLAPINGQDGVLLLRNTLETVRVEDDWFISNVVLTDDQGQMYRQTRFFQKTGLGWLPGAPNTALWGSEQRLETVFFVFHYRQRDAQVVASIAPLVDELYTTLCHNFGLPISSMPEKLVINVSITQPSGAVLVQPPLLGEFSVPSPAIYLAPVKLTDAELLLQSIALPLIDHLSALAVKHHTIGSRWRPLLNALWLWQVWDLDLPLAVWREEIVKWIYVDLPSADAQQPIVLPPHYAELCAMHSLWMRLPLEIQIPLFCNQFDEHEWSFTRWHIRQPPTHLLDFSPPINADAYANGFSKYEWVNYPGVTVVLVTLTEYIVTTYGREHLPALVAGLGQHKTWDTLIPAVFGVSSAEFAAGWQAYLAGMSTRYAN